LRPSKPILNRFQRSRSGAGAGFNRNAPTLEAQSGLWFFMYPRDFGYIQDPVVYNAFDRPGRRNPN